jgi:hypothetical protein
MKTRTTLILLAAIAASLTGCAFDGIESATATFTTGKGGQRIYGVGIGFRPALPRAPSK